MCRGRLRWQCIGKGGRVEDARRRCPLRSTGLPTRPVTSCCPHGSRGLTDGLTAGWHLAIPRPPGTLLLPRHGCTASCWRRSSSLLVSGTGDCSAARRHWIPDVRSSFHRGWLHQQSPGKGDLRSVIDKARADHLGTVLQGKGNLNGPHRTEKEPGPP